MVGVVGIPHVSLPAVQGIPAVRLRCGVNQSVDAHTAVSTILRTMVQNFCPLLPSEVIQEVLHSFLTMVRARINDRVRTFARVGGSGSGGGGSGDGGSGDGGGGGVASDAASAAAAAASGPPAELELLGQVKVVAAAVLPMIVRTAQQLADLPRLRQLVRPQQVS